MSRDIEKWFALLERRGFTHQMQAEHWGEFWWERRWIATESSHSILQIIRANEYIRIVAAQERPAKRTFALYRYVSTEHYLLPKTEFYADSAPGERLSKSQVWKRVLRDLC